MKQTMLVICGVCWLCFGVGCALLLAQYAGELAGWEVFGLGISSGSVLLGMAHITGLFAGMVWCFGVGLLLCAHGLVRADETRRINAESIGRGKSASDPADWDRW